MDGCHSCPHVLSSSLQIPLPQSPPWWLLFDANYEDIEEISLEMLTLYRRPKVSLEELEKRISVHKEELQVGNPSLPPCLPPSLPPSLPFFSPSLCVDCHAILSLSQKKQVEIKEVKLKKAESEPASKKGVNFKLTTSLPPSLSFSFSPVLELSIE